MYQIHIAHAIATTTRLDAQSIILFQGPAMADTGEQRDQAFLLETHVGIAQSAYRPVQVVQITIPVH